MSKIPPHAVRVFKGVIFDVYQWEQMLYDGSTTTFECLKRPDTVIVIPLAGEMVYYAEQAQPGQPLSCPCSVGGRRRGRSADSCQA